MTDQNRENNTLQVVGCIDGSEAALGVCDYAAWASKRMGDPLLLLHVLDEEKFPARTDMSGNIGLGAREHLLDELVELDQQRSKLALKQGHLMLDEAEQRVKADGVEHVSKRQRHDELASSLVELEPEARLFVMGLHGEGSNSEVGRHVGSQLETVIRSVHRPVFLVPDEYTEPRSAMLAFDGSETAFRSIELLAGTPVFRGMPFHLVMIGSDTEEKREQLGRAREILAAQELDVHEAICQGSDVEKTLHAYQDEHGIDVLIMGAYGHSRIRRFLVGSTTTKMLETARKPLVILR
jgi:nucleotide-binding universal stress UspA family protein